MTSWPLSAAARAHARPTTPAPTTSTSMQRAPAKRAARRPPRIIISRVRLLRSDAHLRCRSENFGINLLLVFDEVLLEHAYELACRGVERRLVGPGFHGI